MRHGVMSSRSPNQRFEERSPNGRFLIGTRILSEVTVKGHFGPSQAVGLDPVQRLLGVNSRLSSRSPVATLAEGEAAEPA
jgi:hypothetical protein